MSDRVHRRYRLTVGYVIVVVAVIIALALSLHNQDKIEAQATEDSVANCEAVNESKEALDLVLRVLAAPRSDDLPGEAEGRARLYDQVKHLVVMRDCTGDARR